MTLRPFVFLALALCAALLTAAPATASDAPLFAGYWTEFTDHWTGVFKQQNGVVMLTLGIGVVCLFVITRGKWKK